MNQTVNVVVVEDNRNFAESLKEIILLSENIDCLALFTNAEDCRANLESNNGVSLKADVFIVDLKLSGKSGMQLIPDLRRFAPDSAILILTNNEDYRAVLEAIQLGAAGYLNKDTPIPELRRAIREVHEGGSFIDPKLSKIVLDAVTNWEAVPQNGNILSNREREVLNLMASGCVKKEVAERLGISYSAVALYTSNIYEKLQVNNIAAAVAKAIRSKLI